MKDYAELTEEGRRRRLKVLALDALEEYDLDVVRVRGMTDATNGVFRIDTSDGERYAMRVGLGPPVGHTEAEMQSEMKLLLALSDTSDVVVPRPVAAADGRFVTTASASIVPGERLCAVFTWLEGPLLADRLDAGHIPAYGATMARLHVAAERFTPGPTFTAPRFDTLYPYDLPFSVFTDAGSDLLPPSRRSVFEEGSNVVEDALAKLTGTEKMRILHGDLHPWNVKVNRGRMAVFDFEDMVWGWPVQDIGTALYYLWSRDDFDEMWGAFRAGYSTVAPWPDRGGQVASFIVARTLLMANDVISQPEWMSAAPEIYERGERRIRSMLDRLSG